MGTFTNLETHVEPETTLFQQEVDIILAVIDQVLATFDEYPTQGTFILDGQKMGEDAKCILRFNLENGFCQPMEDTSDDIVIRAIDDILVWPKYLTYGYHGEPNYFGQLPSDIYKYGRRKALVLNTTFGRFVVSFYANFVSGGHEESTALLLAVAESIAQMGKEDKILQKSNQNLQWLMTNLDQNAVALVRDLFHNCAHPTLKAWKEWHEPANSSGELTLFFE